MTHAYWSHRYVYWIFAQNEGNETEHGHIVGPQH